MAGTSCIAVCSRRFKSRRWRRVGDLFRSCHDTRPSGTTIVHAFRQSRLRPGDWFYSCHCQRPRIFVRNGELLYRTGESDVVDPR